MYWKIKQEEFVSARQWKELCSYSLDMLNATPDNVQQVIEAIYLLFDRLVYHEHKSQSDVPVHRESLLELFLGSFLRLGENAEYLFFVGYFITLADWAFGQEDLRLSHKMLAKAHELEPDNLVYEWGYLVSIGDRQAGVIVEKLCLDKDKMDFLVAKGAHGKLIAEAIQTDYSRKLDPELWDNNYDH